MRTLVVPVSFACNQACLFCEIADRLDGTSVLAAKLKQTIDDARAQKIERLVFTGGEPLIAKHVVRAISYAHGLGFQTAITTNGRWLSDPLIVGRLVAACLDEVHISLHAADADTHNALIGGDPIAHTQVLRALKNLSATDLKTTLRTVLTSRNAGEIPGLLALARTHNMRFELRALEASGRALLHPELWPQEPLTLVRDAFELAASLGVPMTAHGFEPAWRSEGAGPSPAVMSAGTIGMIASGLPDAALRAGLLADAAQWEDLAEALGFDLGRLETHLDALGVPRIGTPTPALQAILPQGRPVRLVHPDKGAPPALQGDLQALAQALCALGWDAALTSELAAVPTDALVLASAQALPEALDRLHAVFDADPAIVALLGLSPHTWRLSSQPFWTRTWRALGMNARTVPIGVAAPTRSEKPEGTAVLRGPSFDQALYDAVKDALPAPVTFLDTEIGALTHAAIFFAPCTLAPLDTASQRVFAQALLAGLPIAATRTASTDTLIRTPWASFAAGHAPEARESLAKAHAIASTPHLGPTALAHALTTASPAQTREVGILWPW